MREERDGAAGVRVAALDLGSLASVQEFAEAWDGPLGLLVNNAGLMTPPRYRQTPTGSSCSSAPTTSATSRSPAGCCRPARGAAARVVTVSSIAHHRGAADVLDGNPPRALPPQRGLRQLQAGQPAVRPRAAAPRRPGRRLADLDRRPPRRLARPTWSPASRVSARSRASAARPAVLQAALPVRRGRRRPHAVRRDGGRARLLHRPAVAARVPRPGRARPKLSRLARDEALAAKLWAVSEDLTGVALRLVRRRRVRPEPAGNALS